MASTSTEKRPDGHGVSLRRDQSPSPKARTDDTVDICVYYQKGFGAVAEQLYSRLPTAIDHLETEFGVNAPQIKQVVVKPTRNTFNTFGEYLGDPEIRAVVISPLTPTELLSPILIHEMWHDVDAYQSRIFENPIIPQNLGRAKANAVLAGAYHVSRAIDEGTAQLVQVNYIAGSKNTIEQLSALGMDYISLVVTHGRPFFMKEESALTLTTPEAAAFEQFHKAMMESRNKFEAITRLGAKIRQGTKASKTMNNGIDINDVHVVGFVLALHYLAMHSNDLKNTVSSILEKTMTDVVKEVRHALHNKPKIFDRLYALAEARREEE